MISRQKSEFRGVHYSKKKKKWVACIVIDKKRIYLGSYAEQKDAAKAYATAAKKHGQEDRLLNLTEEEKENRKKQKRKEYIKNNIEKMKQYWHDYHKERYKDKKEQMLERSYLKNQELKKYIMDQYGGCCSCCNEDNLDVLSIDMIIPNKKKHKEIGYGYKLYNWLIKNNFPKDNFQCLCMNCNFAKGMYKICPHEVERMMGYV